MRASYREKGILVKKLINYKGVIISVRRDLPHDLNAHHLNTCNVTEHKQNFIPIAFMSANSASL